MAKPNGIVKWTKPGIVFRSITALVPAAYADQLKLHALRNNSSVDEIVSGVIQRYLKRKPVLSIHAS